jgi:hypothetical protein
VNEKRGDWQGSSVNRVISENPLVDLKLNISIRRRQGVRLEKLIDPYAAAIRVRYRRASSGRMDQHPAVRPAIEDNRGIKMSKNPY